MGDKGLARKVIAGFLNDVPQQLRTLKNRLEAGDAQGARLQAHTLKGAAATVVRRGPASALLRSAGSGGSGGVEPRLGPAAPDGGTIRTAQGHPEAVRVGVVEPQEGITKMRTLIVEDDFTSRLLLQSFLSPYGECHIAVNGKEAVAAFRAAQESGQATT